MDRAIRHHMIAIRCGNDMSLTHMKQLYRNGRATKDDDTKALRVRAYQLPISVCG